MTEDNQENTKSESEEHVPYLAPMDEQIRSGNMGLYLDDYQDKNERKKRYILLLILALTIIGLLMKGALVTQEDRELRREEMLQEARAFQEYVDQKEKMAREAGP